MSSDILICPNCRARVFGNWQACKFCGSSLRVTGIEAAVDPADLVAPPVDPDQGHDGTGGGMSGQVRPSVRSESPWASSAGSPSGVPGGVPGGGPGGGPGEPSDASPGSGWDTPLPAQDSGGFPMDGGASGDGWSPGSDTTWNPDTTWDAPTASAGEPTGTGTLVPVEGADTTWMPGPAPRPDDDGVAGTQSSGTTGLDPVDWYPEPGSSGTTGLDPVDWYTEPTQGDPAPEPESPPFVGGTDADTGDEPWTGDPFATASDSPGDDEDTFSQDFDDDVFDPGAIFREPEPVAGMRDEFGSEIEPVAPGGELAVHWEPAAADAWDTSVAPEGKPKRQAALSRESRLLVGGIILVLLVIVGGMALQNRRADHPSAWTPNVQGIADWVAKSRKSTFEHPIAVVTLDRGAYDAAVKAAANPEGSKETRRLDDQVAMWRSLGAIQGKPNATLGFIAAQRPELGAFYDLEEQRLVLRSGAELGPLHEGIAGALSVAFDDQHNDLSALRSTGIEENPVFSVVLGAAALARADYRRTQGDASVTPFARGTAALPKLTGPDAFLAARGELATRLGEPFVQVVRDHDGQAKANGLAKLKALSSQQVMNPRSFFGAQGALTVPEDPVAPEGTKKLASGTIGAQTWFLLIAAHLDDPAGVTDALDVADRWAGDSFVAYRRQDGQVCVSDVVRTADVADLPLLAAALEKWQATVTGGNIEVKAHEDGTVTVTGCDPGPSAVRKLGSQLSPAITAAVTRSNLGADYYLAGTKVPNGPTGPLFTVDEALCMGVEAVDAAQPAQWAALAAHHNPEYRDFTMTGAQMCGSTLADQLFVDQGD